MRFGDVAALLWKEFDVDVASIGVSGGESVLYPISMELHSNAGPVEHLAKAPLYPLSLTR